MRIRPFEEKCSDTNTIFNIKSLISAQKLPLNVHYDYKCENFRKLCENFTKISVKDPDPDPKKKSEGRIRIRILIRNDPPGRIRIRIRNNSFGSATLEFRVVIYLRNLSQNL